MTQRLLVVCGLGLGCARHLPPAFTAERDAAENAYASKDYRAAAEHWRKAAALSPDARERDEALYREATSEERAENPRRADALYAALEAGPSDRAERAAYARAELVLRQGREAEGVEQLKRALLRFPNSGLGRGAATRLLDYRQDHEGSNGALAEIDKLLERLRGSELEQYLLYRRARLFEATEQPALALGGFTDLARRFPYPFGAYWDEALLSAAALERQAGHPQQAIAHLETLLAARETSRLNGSYERSGYAEARFRIAEIARDDLHDAARARREFRRVWSEHPTSRLRDDALFEEALVALQSDDEQGACAASRTLRQAAPESRFVGCTSDLCEALPKAGTCHEYLAVRIADARAKRASTPHSSSSR